MAKHSLLIIIAIIGGLAANAGALGLTNNRSTDPQPGNAALITDPGAQRTEYTAPYAQNFDGAWLPPDWQEISDDPILGWSPYAGWARCNFNLDSNGALATLKSPYIAIPGYMYRLYFRWSHIQIPDYPLDIGRVKIYDLDNNAVGWVTVWERMLMDFNSNDGGSSFSPGSGVQESIDLSAYAGHMIMVAFEGACGWGPYWFVDNFAIQYADTGIAVFPHTQDFSSAAFPPANWSTPLPGFGFERSAANGYAAPGSGSAKNFSSRPGTSNIDLNSPFINLAGSRGFLSFDQCYADYNDMYGAFDDFEVLVSNNGGLTFSNLASYSGAPGGDLITAPPTNASFVPTAAQWVTRSHILPAGTNMVKFRVISRNSGGILFLDNIRLDLGFTGGSGTPEDPWLITNAAELSHIRNYLGAANAGKCFRLENDLDLLSYLSAGGAGFALWGANGWLPLGNSASQFSGTLDGNGHAISNLRTAYYGNYHGLFGIIGTGGAVKNLVLDSTCYTLGDTETGSLAGRNSGTVQNCHSSATVHIGNAESGGGLVGFNAGTISGSSFSGAITRSGSAVICNKIGGVCGYNQSGAVITESQSTGSVAGNIWCGGIAGWNDGAIDRCQSSGAVSGAANSQGGLVGQHQGSLANSYSRAAVSGAHFIGGLVGYNSGSSITNCYSTGAVSGGTRGGLCGQAGATVINSYWDTQTSGLATSFGGTGKTTAQMMDQATYAGWDFALETANGTNDYWCLTPHLNGGYPILTWEYADEFLPVVLTYPANGATSLPHTGFDLAWAPMPVGLAAVEYELYMGQGSIDNLYDHYFYTTGTTFNPVTQGGLAFNSGETWYWTVNAYSQQGSAVLTDPPSSFQIEVYAAPGIPLIQSVTCVNSTVSLSWSAAELANSYKVYASDTPDVALIPANLAAQVSTLSCELPASQLRKFYRVVASTDIVP